MVVLVDSYVRGVTKDRIITLDEAGEIADFDCILVLGCGLRPDGSPSKLLTDRLNMGIAAYEIGASTKILMSGDHGSTQYDEVNAMKAFAIDRGIISSDVFMDHAGFSTYESLYRASAIFEAKKILIVTQQYHLYRSIYIADKLGIEVLGVAAKTGEHPGDAYREFREKLARVKDFFMVIIKPKPTYLGEMIPVYGNGDMTND